MTEAQLRVAFDATSLLGPRTGVGQVTAQLLGVLARDASLDLQPYAITWRGRGELEHALPAGTTPATRRFPARATRVLWPRVALPKIEHWTGTVDVVHATGFVAPPSRVPVLLTIHDLTFLRFPELCTADTLTYPRLIEAALDRGAIVHTYSEFIAAEVREHFSLPEGRVAVITPGLVPSTPGDADRGRRLAGADRYVLALSTIEPRKNLPMLVRAFDRVAKDDAAISLVVAGPDGWGVDAFEAALRAARYSDRVTRTGYVAETDRHDLLAGAELLAYPSIYEGFGHPPLEAMEADVPVVASHAGSLPEVLGDAALLPDPSDVDALTTALDRALHDDGLRATLVGRGRERAMRYRWDTTAVAMSALYRAVAGRVLQ